MWKGTKCFPQSLVCFSPPGKDYTIQRLLLGTHTSEGAQNYLQIATVQMPKDDMAIDEKRFDEERGEAGGYGRLCSDLLGGSPDCKINVVQKINHDGEVNR